MDIVISSRGRWLSLGALWLLGGCADHGDSCGSSSLQVETAPTLACLQLSAAVDPRPGYYQIVGTNNCTDPLVVHSPGTHDGGPNDTFAVGAQVLIVLNDSEVFNQDTAIKTWQRNAVLGSETIVIKVTKAPC
jgi:hypothetical protein